MCFGLENDHTLFRTVFFVYKSLHGCGFYRDGTGFARLIRGSFQWPEVLAPNVGTASPSFVIIRKGVRGPD